MAEAKAEAKKTTLMTYLLGEGEKRKLSPGLANAVKVIAVGTTLYNIWAVIGYPEPILHRAIGFSLFFALTFMMYTTPGSRARATLPWYDWVLAGLSLVVGIYIGANLDRLVSRYAFADVVTPADMAFGILTMVLLCEGTRRIIGPWLSLLAVIAIAYALLGQFIPGPFGHSGFTMVSIVDELFLTTDGIWSR